MADPMSTSSHKCPVCNGGRFIVYRNRELGQCESCGANERTRVTALFLKKHIRLGPGQRVLHLAPEKQLARYLFEKVGRAMSPAILILRDIRERFLCRSADWTFARI